MAYDKQKAHEYYMRHRKLKGRTKKPTQKLTKEQKIMKSYINAEISNAKKKAIQELREYYKQQREMLKELIARHSGVNMKQVRMLLSQRRKQLSIELKTKLAETRDRFETQRVRDLNVEGIQAEKRISKS